MGANVSRSARASRSAGLAAALLAGALSTGCGRHAEGTPSATMSSATAPSPAQRAIPSRPAGPAPAVPATATASATATDASATAAAIAPAPDAASVAASPGGAAGEPHPEAIAAELERGIAAAHAQTQGRMDDGETFGGSEGVPCVEAIVAARRRAATTIERALRAGLAAPPHGVGNPVACQAAHAITEALRVLRDGRTQAINVDGPGASYRAHCDEPAVPVPAALAAVIPRLEGRCP